MSSRSTSDPILVLSRERIERGSKSFACAARLFSPDVRASAYMLYAWCRYCDDLVDGQELGHRHLDSCVPSALIGERLAVVDTLRRRTISACRGRPDGPVFEALSRVVRQHGIEERYPLELIEGFAMDIRGERCASLAATLLYAYRVAGVVGLMMARVMGATSPDTLKRACDLGIAFQFTNIARDVVEDAAHGRIYLPLDWLAEAGVVPDTICEPSSRRALAAVVARLLDEADRYYASARAGIADLPWRSAMAIGAAHSVYRTIGTRVRSRGAAAWDRRTVVPRITKIALVLGAPASAVYTKIDVSLHRPVRDGLWTAPSLIA